MTGQEFKDLYAAGERDFQNANLNWADLSGADLSDANLSEANLSEANLNWANLSGADLGEANLSGADLGEANLSGADLTNALLFKCNLRGAKIDPGALSAKQIADGCFDDDILEKQGWTPPGATHKILQPARKLTALKVEFGDIDELIRRVLDEGYNYEKAGEALDKLARAWNLNVQGDVIAAAELMEDVNEMLG